MLKKSQLPQYIEIQSFLTVILYAKSNLYTANEIHKQCLKALYLNTDFPWVSSVRKDHVESHSRINLAGTVFKFVKGEPNWTESNELKLVTIKNLTVYIMNGVNFMQPLFPAPWKYCAVMNVMCWYFQ